VLGKHEKVASSANVYFAQNVGAIQRALHLPTPEVAGMTPQPSKSPSAAPSVKPHAPSRKEAEIATAKIKRVAMLKHELEVTVVLGTDFTLLVATCMVIYYIYFIQQKQKAGQGKPISQDAEVEPHEMRHLMPTKQRPKPVGGTMLMQPVVVSIDADIGDEGDAASMVIDA
jgi:hypothetical protein